ncbi:hypothetical protein BGZ57DRAFT_38313 [Hyaloscypha finlandica]|nr:hypothetical protein BGZ57DRAFT_38313 [Hyaloscypha finlandica]
MGADDARLPSLHEIARGHIQPTTRSETAPPGTHSSQSRRGPAPLLPARSAAAACLSVFVCLSVCLSVRTPACPLCVQPACAPPLLDPRSSILTTPHFLASRFSLLAPPGLPRQLQDSQAKRRTPLPPPPQQAIPLPAQSHSQSLRCWTHHPKVTRPPALHTSARPRPPLVRARVCLTEQASHDASLPPSLRPCLRTRTTATSTSTTPVTSSSPVHITPT